MTRPRLARLRSWYARFERPFSSISLVGGFVFDAVTLKRVDLFWENFWVVAHLLIVAVCIIWLNLKENKDRDEANPDKIHFWLVNVMQFFFGGILSTYLVFYFRSGTILTSWPFLLILLAAFVANESFKRHYARLTFQLSLFFLSVFAFSIFLLPVLLRTMGPQIFLLSGGASLGFITLFLWLLKSLSGKEFGPHRKWTWAAIWGIFLALNGLYFANIIPPIPLSLKNGAVYHSLVVNAPGRYTVAAEPKGLFAFLRWADPVHLVPDEPLYAYSAVFSPTAWSTTVIHEWQWYDSARGEWRTRGRIPLAVRGGADGGYRTYSMETGLTAGPWRVNVQTPQGQVIGRLRFEIILTNTQPPLQIKNVN